jgi:hypothetical protein
MPARPAHGHALSDPMHRAMRADLEAARVRRAIRPDAEPVPRVYADAYRENRELGFPGSAETVTTAEIAEWIERDSVWVAEAGRAVVGAVRVRVTDGAPALGRLGVLLAMKGRGIGSARRTRSPRRTAGRLRRPGRRADRGRRAQERRDPPPGAAGHKPSLARTRAAAHRSVHGRHQADQQHLGSRSMFARPGRSRSAPAGDDRLVYPLGRCGTYRRRQHGNGSTRRPGPVPAVTAGSPTSRSAEHDCPRRTSGATACNRPAVPARPHGGTGVCADTAARMLGTDRPGGYGVAMVQKKGGTGVTKDIRFDVPLFTIDEGARHLAIPASTLRDWTHRTAGRLRSCTVSGRPRPVRPRFLSSG